MLMQNISSVRTKLQTWTLKSSIHFMNTFFVLRGCEGSEKTMNGTPCKTKYGCGLALVLPTQK